MPPDDAFERSVGQRGPRQSRVWARQGAPPDSGDRPRKHRYLTSTATSPHRGGTHGSP
jgi:hypothetical protein